MDQGGSVPLGGERRGVNVTHAVTDGTVVWSFKAIRPCVNERYGLNDVTTSGHWSSVRYHHGAGPSDQGHLPDDFRRAAYNHVAVFGRYTDLLSAAMGVRTGLQIFTL